jgi:hypothetical protein
MDYIIFRIVQTLQISRRGRKVLLLVIKDIILEIFRNSFPHLSERYRALGTADSFVKNKNCSSTLRKRRLHASLALVVMLKLSLISQFRNIQDLKIMKTDHF